MSTLSILVVDDEVDIRGTLSEVLGDEGYQVHVAANAAEARAIRANIDPDLILLDIWMPDTDGITLLREWSALGALGCPVVMMSGHGTVETAVEATRLGAFDFVEKPLSLAKLLRVVERALESSRKARTRIGGRPSAAFAPVGKSPLIQQLREQVQSVAAGDASVLFVGETGSGREAFARYLHSLSPYADGPFVSVAGGSLDEGNASLRLRGSEREEGLEKGLYEQAAGGTLFLNGLGDFSPAVQRILLADLDARSYTPVDGRQSRPIRVRLVSSAEEGFEQQRSGDTFRPDLLAHLSLVKIRIPSLREYAQDVPELLRYYVDRLVDEQHLALRRFGVAAQNRLRNYPWPFNVRELRNLVHRLLLLGGNDEISLQEVESELAVQRARDEPLVKQDLLALPLREAREAFERAYLQQQLTLCGGKVGQLAKRVGMERTHLYRKLHSLGVDFKHSTDD